MYTNPFERELGQLLTKRGYKYKVWRTLFTLGALLCISHTLCSQPINHRSPADYVNPLIGTASPSNPEFLGNNPPKGEELYYGCVTPAAMVVDPVVKLGPNTGFDGIYHVRGASYRYTDSSIIGFTHLQHEYNQFANILFIPTVGEVMTQPGTREKPEEGYRSDKQFGSEVASAGYYSVVLKKYNIKVDLTATQNCGFHRYKFPKSAESNILIDLSISQVREPVLNSAIEVIGPNTVSGWQECKTFKVYFYAIFSEPFSTFGSWENGIVKHKGSTASGTHSGAYLRFKTNGRNETLCKVGISFVSVEDAKNKLLEEIVDWDFDRVHQQAKRGWNEVLSKIQVEGGTEREKEIFYTSVYRVVAYEDFLSWQRAQAITIFTRGLDWMNAQMSKYLWVEGKNSFWGIGKASGFLGLYNRGVTGGALAEAYRSLKKDALGELEATALYAKYGFIPSQKKDIDNPLRDGGRVPGADCVNRTLGYAYDDYCLSKMAELLGENAERDFFYRRSKSYKNLFDTLTGFMRPRNHDNSWVTPFNPSQPYAQFFYREGTAWQYLWLVPHDIPGLANLMGGKHQFEKMLDSFFTSRYNPKEPMRDITGVVGQYTHGNEIDRYVPYLYNYTNSRWKTQKMVRFIMDQLYDNTPEGLCGMDDNGLLSGWYAQSALGFYPVDQSGGTYETGSPIFSKVTIKLGPTVNDVFTIEAVNASEKNKYVESVELNGKALLESNFHHSSIIRGGKLVFKMSATPSKK